MELIVTILLGTLVRIVLDPVVLIGTITVVALLVSGVAARAVEALQDLRGAGRGRAQAIRVNGNS